MTTKALDDNTSTILEQVYYNIATTLQLYDYLVTMLRQCAYTVTTLLQPHGNINTT